MQFHAATGAALNTFLEGFVDIYLARGKVLVVLHVRENTPLVDPVVVVGTEEEDGEVADVVAEALDVGRHQARVADFRWPPPAAERQRETSQRTHHPAA